MFSTLICSQKPLKTCKETRENVICDSPNLKLQYTFRSTIFFKFRFFFCLSKDPNEISNVKKKSLKKIQYWQRNGGFVLAGSKNYQSD